MRTTTFSLVWGGQLVSLLLSSASGIALAIWVFEQTGSAAALAAVVATKSAIGIFAAPLLGAVADRFSRKPVIVLCDLTLAACSVLLIGATSSTGRVVAVLVIVALTGFLDGLLSVTMAASLRELRAEADLTRANGLVAVLEATPTVVAPLIGAALSAHVGLQLVLALDGSSFVVASAFVLVARWPRADRDQLARPVQSPFRGAAAGFRLVFADADLARLQLAFAGVNTLTGLGTAAVTTFLLSAAGGGAMVLGTYNTIGALGLLAGGAVVTMIGPRLSRSVAVLGGLAVAALGGRVFLGLSPVPASWVVSAGIRSMGVQISNAPLTALWQEQTAVADQGKVFGARRLLGQGTFPLAVAGGGLLADAVQRSWPGAGLACEITLLGLLEVALVVLLHCSGAMRRITDRQRG